MIRILVLFHIVQRVRFFLYIYRTNMEVPAVAGISAVSYFIRVIGGVLLQKRIYS